MWTEALSDEILLEKAAGLKQSGFKPGCDDMTAKSAELWLRLNSEKLRRSVLRGDYTPMPVSGFRTAKVGGGFRQLVRLTAIDTIVQRCILDGISADCEARFFPESYAFRPGLGVTKALEKYCELGSGHVYVSKVDFADCFGSMDHSVLAKALHEFFNDEVLCRLLMSCVSVPMYDDGRLVHKGRGVYQGSPLSPTLCNIYLTDLDRLIKSFGFPFIRYADDLVIFSNDKAQLEALTENVIGYVSSELSLHANGNKSILGSPLSISYLGHTFVSGKDGVLSIECGESAPAAYHAWNSRAIKNPGKDVNVLSDGILRQRDFSIMMETETDKYDIPIMNTERINVFSNVIFDTGFLEKASERGIVISVFDRYGHLKGRYLPNVPLRSPAATAAQLAEYSDEEKRLELAKKFVSASVHNSKLVIRYYRKHNDLPIYTEKLDAIESAEKEIASCPDYKSLLLHEARLRELYYGCYDSFLAGSGFHFDRRSRRPPKNPVNALLSFGNTVLYSYIATLISKTALDVRVGFLHATSTRMESLNLDIAEIFRPIIIDRTVFTLFNRRQLRRDRHFVPMDDGGIYLGAEGKRVFLEAFTDKLNTRLNIKDTPVTYSELMKAEVYKLVRHFRTGEKYSPFRQVR